MSDAITYQPSPAGLDSGCYDVKDSHAYRGDRTFTAAGLSELEALATSSAWEDRVRAEVLRGKLRITLPDRFPAIYETPDSPNQARHLHKRPSPWVISPDIDMLEALLEDYQALWDGYTSQWGPGSRRTFAVGRLDGMTPHGVYRPGTTPEQVLGATMLTHDGMYARAPERLKAMHPCHAQWTRTRAERTR